MNINFEYRPLPVHEAFHRDTTYERAMFGAFGSGKTYATVAEAIAFCLEQPGVRGLIARKTAPELRDTTEPIFRELIPPDLWRLGEDRRSGGHMESFTFPNGSKVLFRSLDDWNKHRSLNVGFIAYDEMNEIDEETYLGMASRVRQRDITAEARAAGYKGEITRRGIWGATNPSGHDWIWRRFVGPEKHPNTSHHKSTTLDNPYLPVEYIESLLQYPLAWIKRYVLCDFDDFAGAIYEDWNWDTHVIKPLKEYERGAAFLQGFDPGTRNPTAGLWVYHDKVNRRYIAIDEYEEAGLSVDIHCQAFRKIEASHRMIVRTRISDPVITTRDRGSMISLHSQYAKAGFNFQLGPSSYDVRIPTLGRLIKLKRFVVTENCPRTFEAIKNYRWADLTPATRMRGEDPKEVPHKQDDHLVDCAQYIASRDVLPPSIHKPSDIAINFNDEIHRAIRKQLQTRTLHRRTGSHDLGSIPV